MITNWKSGLWASGVSLWVLMASCGERADKQQVTTETDQNAHMSSKASAEVASISFQDETGGKIFAGYQKIRMGLTNDDPREVKAAAGDLAENLPANQEKMNNTVLAMASTDDITAQRQLLSELTESIEPMIEKSLSGGTIYKQFCPMAFDGKGGYWLSVNEEIRNPYFGEKMLKCGTVKETIRK